VEAELAQNKKSPLKANKSYLSYKTIRKSSNSKSRTYNFASSFFGMVERSEYDSSECYWSPWYFSINRQQTVINLN